MTQRLRPLTLLLALVILLTFLPCPPVRGENEEPPSDLDQVIKATNGTEQDFDKLKKRLLNRYTPLIRRLENEEKNYVSMFSSGPNSGGQPEIPETYQPWWFAQVHEDINPQVPNLETDISDLFSRALTHSSQIKVFQDLPLIRQTTIQEAQGEFDFRLFAEGRFTDLDEPVGDDLKTGGPLRYEEDSQSIEYGIKKKFITGTDVELKQSIGGMDTNSTYFNPHDQARTGTWLTIRQPLLKRFGIRYNETALRLAGIDTEVAREELRRNIESHLLEICRAYWGLYLERSLLVQKSRLAEKTAAYLEKMQQRASMDVSPSLLARARSLVAGHKLAAMQAEYAMLNAQSRIRALVNDPDLTGAATRELVTRQMPVNRLDNQPVESILTTALENRPEVVQAMRQIQSARLRLERADNETLPDLDLFFQTYVRGLDGDYSYDSAYSRQFDEGEPSFVGGLRIEFPLGNNSARARLARKKLEIRQLLHQLDTTVENVLLEAQVSYREMKKNYRSMAQGYQIMQADRQEIDALLARVDYLLAQNQPYGDVLYQLMDASERLARSEEQFTKSELTYNYSLYNLYRAMGILLSSRNLTIEETTGQDQLPLIRVHEQSPAQN